MRFTIRCGLSLLPTKRGGYHLDVVAFENLAVEVVLVVAIVNGDRGIGIPRYIDFVVLCPRRTKGHLVSHAEDYRLGLMIALLGVLGASSGLVGTLDKLAVEG